MKQILICASAILLVFGCNNTVEEENFTSYVDTSIGSGGHGHVFVGASVPFGAVQLGPTSIPSTWDWCSGYHVSDSSVVGFSHTHLSGTGIGDLFDVTLLPVTGDKFICKRDLQADYADRSKEISTPGYYSVPLMKSGVIAEMTATERVGLSRYTFPINAEKPAVILDLMNGGCWDKVSKASVKIEDNSHISGYRFSKGWANNQKLWFAAEFSEPFTSSEQLDSCYWRFNFSGSKPVMVKVSISPKSCEGAISNMAAELPGWDFEQTCDNARQAWNKELAKVRISTSDCKARTIFYTALYHTMIVPSLFCDAGEEPRYTTLSLWDTYRAQMPLFTILHPEMEDDMIKTFLDIYDAQGKLPVWHLHGCETDCMVGNPGIPVVADAIQKGFNGFDVEKAYEAMKVSATMMDRGQDYRMRYGYIPCDAFGESVAYDMEYAIADWALAQTAKQLGYAVDYDYFLGRSHSYRRYFDPETGFVRGVTFKGKFRKNFDPYSASHRANDYCEGNAWQYTWLVPHDFEGLCSLFKDDPIAHLDSLFTANGDLGEDASADISGLIGQYAHGNEPSHHIVYFYTMAGQPWKTADLVRRICTELYRAEPDGLCGNEDAGQMSAWYILSSMGFYQVEPSGGRYFFGTPLFDSVSIDLPEGKSFNIIASNNSSENKYIQSVTLNGEPYGKAWIDYADIMAGGELKFEMGSEKTVWY